MRKLMIADDENGIRTLVRMTLENERYEILEASDGPEALRVAREHRPDLLLLDVEMPGMTGIEVCRALKQDPQTTGIMVVMLTAKAEEADRLEGEASGADDYITKPFSPVALMRKVDEVFSRGEEA